MLSEYKKNIEVQKEVLASLPRNNKKNEKLYQEKIEELLKKYKETKEVVLSEILKRKKRYESLEYDKRIDTLAQEINKLSSSLPILNQYNSSYEKSKLNILLYELGHFYETELEKVNIDIKKTINLFETVGIKLTPDKFIYSFYSNKYMEKFLTPNITEEELKKSFEELYWKCPDIIAHITLNFKYLYYQNKKKFDAFYKNIILELENNKTIEKYQELYQERSELIRNNSYLLQNSFLEEKLNINDYTEDKIKKSYKSIISEEPTEQIKHDVIKLYNATIEYKNYLDYEYIINNIKQLYKEKDKYKNIYNNKKKEIDKIEKKLFNDNKKIPKIKNQNKIDVLNSSINNNIKTLKNLYEELEENYFLEQVAKLDESTTLYDMLNLATSNYNYLIKQIKENEKEEMEINKLNKFITNPRINILKTILINEEKDISMLIIDRFNLFGFELKKEQLERENIEVLIKDLEIILGSIAMDKLGITVGKIKYIKETNNIE